MPATAVFALSKLTNTPFSMGAHAYDVFRMGGDWLLRMKFQDALFIRTSSKSTAVRIEEIGVVPEKIKLIRRGIAEWPIRESYELVSKKCLELVSVGRLVEKKGYYHQLQIAAHLRSRDIPFRLRIVGTGPLEKSLLKERNRLGLDGFVEFTGSKTEQEVRAIYLQSDVFLFTGVIAKNGDRDGIPNVIPEAMSAGCLILASLYAGASEPFIEDVSGFSMNPLNPKDWIDILTEFWFNPEAFTIMRKYAVNHAKKAFDIASGIFEKVSFDLIYGRQYQSLQSWELELSEAIKMSVGHLSLYQLTIEDNTRFGDLFAKGKLLGLPEDKTAVNFFNLTVSKAEINNIISTTAPNKNINSDSEFTPLI